jgi:hypothetical protein
VRSAHEQLGQPFLGLLARGDVALDADVTLRLAEPLRIVNTESSIVRSSPLLVRQLVSPAYSPFRTSSLRIF